jgi:large subunit ribosomal protein L4
MIIKSQYINDIEVADTAFGVDYNESLVHQVITAEFASQRSGTKAQKNRAAVSGGGKKPWKQKGTGRARAGTTRSNIWVGGGRAFAATPRDHTKKVNKKMYQKAMKSILSELNRKERLVVVNEFSVPEAKTKKFIETIASFKVKNALIIVEAFDESLWLSTRNLINYEVIVSTQANALNLIRYDSVIITLPALKMLEERLV